MITYKLSRREKFLLLGLAIVLVAVAWFILVYQNTTNQIIRLESEISSAQTSIELDTSRVAQMTAMQQVIDERKAEGADTTEVPEYDNLKPLMDELNAIMARVGTYSLTFDEIDDTTNASYVYRGVRIDFSCDSYATAESVVTALANGAYPCVIDTVSIIDGNARYGTASKVSSSVHVTFFEKYPTGSSAEVVDASADTGSAASSPAGSASAA